MTTVSRADWTDSWVAPAGDECAVFVGGQVIVLSELATALVQAVGTDTPLDDLVATLVAAYGEPPGGAADATRSAVDELVASGILTLDIGGEAE